MSDEVKNPEGRPTKYKLEYCKMLVEHMSLGYSFESFAGVVCVCKQTIYNWLEEFPEFLDAKKTALEVSRLFWETQGIKGLWSDKDSNLNTTAWIFNMKNRFNWRDKIEEEVKHSGTVDHSQTIKISDEHLDKLIEAARGKK